MALDFLNIGAPGPASAFPGAPSSSALGPDANILAFLQAMVDASTLADADVVALATAAPAQDGDTTGATGTSPARAVVPPWQGAIDPKLLALLAQYARSSDAAAIPTDTPTPTDVPPATELLTPSEGEVLEHFVRSGTGNVSSADLPAEPSVPEPDDSEAEAAAFLLMVATLPQTVPAPPVADLPSDTANSESESVDAVSITSDVASQRVSVEPSSVAGVAPLVAGADAGVARSTAGGIAESAADRSSGATSKPQAAADLTEMPTAAQGASARENAGARASSPRVQAFLRAMQQSKALSLSATAENAAQQLYADMAAAPLASDALSTERALWTAAAERLPATPAPERPVRETSPTPTASRPATDPLGLRSQLTTAVVTRLLEDTLSSSTSGRHNGDHESSLFSGHRPQTLAVAKDGASPALFALPSQFDVTGAASPAESIDPPAGTQARLPNEDAVASTLVRSMHWQYRNGVGTAVVQLDPGYLGPVRIALHVEGGTVSATLHAASAEVRAWVLANESALRQSLSTQGLALDRLVVADDDQLEQYVSPDGRGQGEQQEQDRPRPRRVPQPDEGRIFEIVV